MQFYKLDIPPHVARIIRKLPPDIKKSLKEALRAISQEPDLGEPLRGELRGLWNYRVRRYRVVYAILQKKRTIQVYAIGHRKEIYDKINL